MGVRSSVFKADKDLDPVVRSSIKFNHGLSVNQSFKS